MRSRSGAPQRGVAEGYRPGVAAEADQTGGGVGVIGTEFPVFSMSRPSRV